MAHIGQKLASCCIRMIDLLLRFGKFFFSCFSPCNIFGKRYIMGNLAGTAFHRRDKRLFPEGSAVFALIQELAFPGPAGF